MAWRTAMYNAQDEEQDIGFGDAASIDALNATVPGIDATKVAADVKANTAKYQAAVDGDKGRSAENGRERDSRFRHRQAGYPRRLPLRELQSSD